MDYVAIFIAGLFSSLAHCTGMCGGFVLHLSLQTHSWQRQFLYHLGRTSIYVFWGALSGTFSHVLFSFSENSLAQTLICAVAGSIIVLIALQQLNWVRKFGIIDKLLQIKSLSSLFKATLQEKNALAGLYFGLFTGFLPCALLWGFVSYASTKASVLESVLTMFVFALSTIIPLLILGFTGTKLKLAAKTKLKTVAAVIMLFMGIITILRGIPWVMMNFHYYVMKYNLMIHPE